MSIEKLRIEDTNELGQMITKEIDQIEKGLTVICSNVPINDRTTLDVLCHDDNGQLVILQLGVNEDDFMLFRGIQSMDYVDKFKSFLKATYNKHNIDDSEKPRLILVAPSFSDAMRHAVEGMSGMHIDLYDWEYLKLGDHKGFRLQPVFTVKSQDRSRDEKPEKKHESKPKKKEPEPEPAPAWTEEVKSEPPKEDFAEPLPPPEQPKEEPPKRKKFF